jgi:DNA-binding NarL/FixJ family response regulator
VIDPETRNQVKALLRDVRERPTELPIASLLELARRNVHVAIDRQGPEPVVFVSPRPDPCFNALSKREYEVATLVAAGLTNQHIADALFISLGTVKDHVHAILTKTELPSRAAVAASWYGRG